MMMTKMLKAALLAGYGALALSGCKSTLDQMNKTMKSSLESADASMQKNLDFLEGRIGPYDEYVFGVNWAKQKAGAGLYKPNHRFNDYLQKVGTTIALATHYPYTYAGYSFAVIDSSQRNAVAVPAGFIFITRGLLQVAENEDQLAAILAHELAHHELRHNMADVASGKAMQVMKALLSDDGSSQDDSIMEQMAIGYDRQHELEADRRAIELLALAGYDPHALVQVLESMRSYGGSLGGEGYPEGRDKLARQHIAKLGLQQREIPDIRTRRFSDAISGYTKLEMAQSARSQ